MATAVDFWNEVDRRIDARISGISGMAGTESADGTSAPPPAAGGLPIHNNAHHEPPLALQSDLESLTFLDLLDTPATYAGSPLFLLRVNAGATAIEFADGSLLYDSAGAAAASMADHLAAVDPHPQYLTPAEGNALYSLLGHLQAVTAGGTGLTGIAANNLIYSSEINAFSATPITAFARGLIDDANAAAARTTLELNAGEAGDIWVEKAGDTMTGTLTVDLASASDKGVVIQGAAAQAANLLEFQNSAAAGIAAIDGEGRMALGSSTTAVGTWLKIINTLTIDTADQFGVNAALFSNPGGGSTARFFGFQGTARTGTEGGVKNNENHTGAFHGVSASVVHNGDGTMSTAIGALLAISIRSGADGTITNAYGAQISTPSLGGGSSAITSYAGLAIASTTTPGNETYVLLGTTTIPSGSFAIHSTTTFDSYLAGALGLGTSTPGAMLDVMHITAPVLRLSRNDTTVTLSESLGKVEFYGNDTQLSTQNIFGNIEVQAQAAIASDAAFGKMLLRTTGPGTATSPVERLALGLVKTPLTDAAANNLFEVTLNAGQMAGGTIHWTIIASNGTDHQSYSGIATYAVVNKAGTYTKQITHNTANDSKAVSSGTLTATWDILDGTNKVTIRVTPTGSLVETTYQILYSVLSNSPQTIVVP